MMTIMPYLLSSTTDGLLRATRKLEQATQESWSTNWSQMTLQCPHRVMINHSFVLGSSLDSIRRFVNEQHVIAGRLQSRRKSRRVKHWALPHVHVPRIHL